MEPYSKDHRQIHMQDTLHAAKQLKINSQALFEYQCYIFKSEQSYGIAGKLSWIGTELSIQIIQIQVFII